MEMWWEGIRVRDRLALQHDSVLFFQAVWSKIQESLSTENERAREVGEKRERGRRIDWGRERERDGVVGYTTHQWISCSFVLLLMLLIIASDVSHLGLFESDMKSDNMLLIKWPAPARVACLYFGACWWFWVIQPPTFQPVDRTYSVTRHGGNHV